MADSNIAARNPEFNSLLNSLTVETERFRQAILEKQRLLSELGGRESISIEDRKAFIAHLKVEQEIYHGIHNLQERVIRMLREESRR